MKKMIHVGILSVGLMLSNAALAETKDEFAHMRNSPKNMTAEQAEQVEAGNKLKLFVDTGKRIGDAISKVWNKPATQRGVQTVKGAYWVNEAHQVYQDYKFGDQCR
ncbi:hypothetical protein [Conchiformibius steedae]|uniref:Uncharacterized protein n=1 Tax=Conchiformibius steedae TaxID=153493 RepID=A0A3P2A0U1_9NEIS|nr:hypothetical protein [Conchiformibius steedae]RRD88635.1 hypothetical protein EII21_11180 [Conchiformibius steedae]